MSLLDAGLNDTLKRFFLEDDLSRNAFYDNSLPMDLVECKLKIKSNLTLAGLPFFLEVFRYLGAEVSNDFLNWEGHSFLEKEKKELSLKLPFALALTGERIALNLLQRASSIATTTKKFVDLAEFKGIKILCTRKTTPGLRFLEKYAVRVGGGHNHRFGQSDAWMIKDNHKSFFGGLAQAYDFFQNQRSFYTPIIAEIHDLEEIQQAKKLGIRHLLLDNFSPSQVEAAIKLKEAGMTYEVSGGMSLDKVSSYLISGVDAISVGALTHSPEKVDLSFKFGAK